MSSVEAPVSCCISIKIQGIIFQKTVILRNGMSMNKNVTTPLSCYLPSTGVEKYGCLMSSAD